MGLYKNINFRIYGQVDGEGREADVLEAKFKVLCAEYGLRLEEIYEYQG